jgi:hypothetical protein
MYLAKASLADDLEQVKGVDGQMGVALVVLKMK